MLAWGALAFPSGYQKARQMPQVLQTARWGSDYLLKTWKPDTLGPKSAGYLIIYQVQPPALPSVAVLLCCEQGFADRCAVLCCMAMRIAQQSRYALLCSHSSDAQWQT